MAHAIHPAQAFSRHAAKTLPPMLSCVRLTTYSARCALTGQPVIQEQGLQQDQQLKIDWQQQQQQEQQRQQQLAPLDPEQQQEPSMSSLQEQQPLLDDWCQRSRLLVGADGLARLSALNVLLVGLGGVGSFAAEFLCRAGVGSMTLVDGDTVDTTNRNRQLPALRSTVGQLKTQVVAQRLTDINPGVKLTVHQEFLDPVRAAALVQEQQYHYVIDCIDSVAPKQALLLAGHQAGIPTISSMGAGGRLDPSRVRLADISDTYNDAFAAVVRKRLRKAGVRSGITVVFSDEPAKPASLALTQQQYKRSYFGTSSYIPALFGLYIASHVIRQVVEPGYKSPKPAASSAGGSSCSSNSSSSLGRKRSSKKGRSSSDNTSSGTYSGAQYGSTSSSSSSSSLSSVDSVTGSWVDSSAGWSAAAAGTSSAAAATAAATAAAVIEDSRANSSRHLNSDSEQSPASTSIGRAKLQESKHSQQSGTPAAAAAPRASQQLYGSFEQSQGVGMGLDGEGL